MAKLVWDDPSKRFYETGISNMTLYVKRSGSYDAGVAWNGVTSFSESPSGAEASAVYADNIKYLNLISVEEFGATIEAIQYPNEFLPCLGIMKNNDFVISQQRRYEFGLAYKTLIGSNDNGTDEGYKIHLVYGCSAAPSEKAYATINESPENMTFSWTITTTPVSVKNHKSIAHLELDPKKLGEAKTKAIEDYLWGTEDVNGYLPLPDQIVELLKDL